MSNDPNDVGAIIARAAELKQQSEDRLTSEQLREVAAELGIEAKFVDDAVKDLERRQREKAAADAAFVVERAKRNRTIAVAAGVVAVVVVVVVLVARSAAVDGWGEVEAARANVAASIERQTQTQAMFAGRTGDRDADAELAGALNRVSIAKRRYDEAVAAWNTRGLFVSIGAALTSAPPHAPTSSERTSW